MATTNLGRIKPLSKGDYNALTNYENLDIVSYLGSSYICKLPSTGNLPTNTTYWDLVASKGNTGEVTEAELATQVTTKRVHLNSVSTDTLIPFEIHNQGGQAGTDVSSEVTHHYTDATAKVIDNVGDGTILMLSNSQNEIMRPDKPSNYVGNGSVLKYRKFNDTNQIYDEILIMDSKGNIERKNIEEALTFICRKTNNGFPAFTFDSPTAQTIPLNIRNGGSFLTIQDENSFTKVAFVSAVGKTTGLEFRAEAGNLYLQAPNGSVQALYRGALYQVQLVISATTANRPSTSLVKGRSVFDETLGKPIWWNGTAWVDAMGTVV